MVGLQRTSVKCSVRKTTSPGTLGCSPGIVASFIADNPSETVPDRHSWLELKSVLSPFSNCPMARVSASVADVNLWHARRFCFRAASLTPVSKLPSPRNRGLAKLSTVEYNIFRVKLDNSAGLFSRMLQYAFYDWTRDMLWSRRVLTVIGLLIQLSALVLALTRPTKPFILSLLIYMVGLFLLNGMLTSEFVRKTQLESDQIAAEQIQQTLHPQKLTKLPGYHLETFYQPLRGVGGDYFDVIELSDGRTLFAVADVSGKGMPA